MNAPPPSPDATSLPAWMVYFAFFASLTLTILFIIEIISRLVRIPSLDFRVTREVFFRLLPGGESLYSHAVLVAHNDGALIENVTATLEKTSGASKSFNLKIVQFAEKHWSEKALSAYYFYSTSPWAFIPENVPQRIAYICSQEDQATSIEKAFSGFELLIRGMKPERPSGDVAAEQEFIKRLDQLVKRRCSEIMGHIQVEPGEYKLRISVHYNQKSKFLRRRKRKKATSSITFKVGEEARHHLEMNLERFLGQTAVNILTDRSESVSLPEYAPIEVTELQI